MGEKSYGPLIDFLCELSESKAKLTTVNEQLILNVWWCWSSRSPCYCFRLSGTPPFKSKDEDSLYDLIKRGELDFSDEFWATVSVNGRQRERERER